MEPAPPRLRIYVDADACPVKDEIYRVAARYGINVVVVANSPILVPRAPALSGLSSRRGRTRRTTGSPSGPGRARSSSRRTFRLRAVASRAGADVLAPTGKRFSEDSIGMALATRNLMDHLRETGQATSGPKAFGPRDRSNFLSALDNAVTRLKRSGATTREAGDRSEP